MNELFYVPSLEEFHVGFQYERMNGDKWESAEIDVNDFYATLARGYENEIEEISKNLRDVRVKYLDKDDFESLKYFQKREISTHYEYLKAIHSPAIIGKSFDVSILQDKHDPTKIMVFDVTLSKHSIFSGKIRNISELKVLLKQLGI